MLKISSLDGAVAEERLVQSISNEAKMDEELESVKAEMGVVREENERLKTKLKQIEKDYQSLKIRFFHIFQQESSKDSSLGHEEAEEEQHELVCLSLGRSSSSGRSTSEPKKGEKSGQSSKANEEQLKEELTLGLNQSWENSFEEAKEDQEARERGPPSKVLKTMINGDDALDSQQNYVKRARVSVRVRCDAPTMSDGCQWRKYGQKISKGNPCPRAYYRCTVAPVCPVRKQVQRCFEDMSILITTYEGTHNHPLPISATAMASTTSAAASVLLSASSTSAQGGHGGAPATAEAPIYYNLHGLPSANLYDSSTHRQFYIPNSTSPPTVTLDLTTSSSSSSSLFNISSSGFPSTAILPSTSSLSFSSSGSSFLPTLWGNGNLTQGTLPYNRSHMGSFNFGTQSRNHLYENCMDKNIQADPPQQLFTETLTKAITSDPSFRSVIAAAMSSMVHGGGKNQG